jgi:hypothetical protein
MRATQFASADAPSTTRGGRGVSGLERQSPGEQLALFGPPPLINGEDLNSYEELLARICGVVKPADILGHILVRDVIDNSWEVLRLRRLQANLMQAHAYRGMRKTLSPLVGVLKAQTLAEAWAARRPGAVEEINEVLASAGLSMETVMANTLSFKLDEFERIDRMITVAEARRNAALQEIERHRETLGKKLRQAVQELERGGQLRVIENRSTEGEAE